MVTWRRRYKDWRDRNGRFANLPPLPGRDRSTSSIPQSTPQSQLQAPHEQTPSQASPRPSTPPLPVSGLTPTGKVSVGLSSREDRLRQYYPMSLQGHTYVAISKALARKVGQMCGDKLISSIPNSQIPPGTESCSNGGKRTILRTTHPIEISS